MFFMIWTKHGCLHGSMKQATPRCDPRATASQIDLLIRQSPAKITTIASVLCTHPWGSGHSTRTFLSKVMQSLANQVHLIPDPLPPTLKCQVEQVDAPTPRDERQNCWITESVDPTLRSVARPVEICVISHPSQQQRQQEPSNH